MKKTYKTPETEVLNLTVENIIASSIISSDVGIGYGGVDSNGSIEPSSRIVDSDVFSSD